MSLSVGLITSYLQTRAGTLSWVCVQIAWLKDLLFQGRDLPTAVQEGTFMPRGPTTKIGFLVRFSIEGA